MDIKITRDGKTVLSLLDLCPPGTQFVPVAPGEISKGFSANSEDKRISMPMEDTDTKNFSQHIFSLLHEVGHLYQGPPSDEYRQAKTKKLLLNVPRSEEYWQETSYKERNAWARALEYVRQLRKRDIDLVASFGSTKEIFDEVNDALGTYELNMLKELGEDFRGLVLKHEIPQRPHSPQ